MKRAGIWFWMLLKRQLKKPSLYIVIICMVVCCFVIRSAASGFTVNLAVGIMNEDTGEKQAEDGDDAGIAADITELMESHRGLLRFAGLCIKNDGLLSRCRTYHKDVYPYVYRSGSYPAIRSARVRYETGRLYRTGCRNIADVSCWKKKKERKSAAVV